MNDRLKLKHCMVVAAILLTSSIYAFAHCDSIAGPVAKDVRIALASGQLSPVLKWVRHSDEPELRKAFDRAVTVRKSGKEAAELADQYFLETAIRLHRASEGEPYTGVKPVSAADEPAPKLVDSALKSGSLDSVEEAVLEEIGTALREKIEHLQKTHLTAENSPSEGREYVKAYVNLIHYIERLESSVAHEQAGHE